MKEYSTLSRAPELEPHHQMQSSVIPSSSLIFGEEVLLFCKDISKVKLATVVEGDQKAPFSIATTLRWWGGRYSFPRIILLFP